MGLFTNIGYERLAKERQARFIREGRAGESLGFTNRPDLNYPWDEESRFTTIDAWICVILALIGLIGIVAIIWSDHFVWSGHV
jgi:hypothetical protein